MVGATSLKVLRSELFTFNKSFDNPSDIIQELQVVYEGVEEVVLGVEGLLDKCILRVFIKILGPCMIIIGEIKGELGIILETIISILRDAFIK